jgi:hypothetical protein
MYILPRIRLKTVDMKKLFTILGILLFGGIVYFLYGIFTTRSHSPGETTSISHQGLDVKIVYYRPFKKGRIIFGPEEEQALVPYDKYWRLGANDATEITFNKDVTFVNKPVQAGSYRIYAVPRQTSWQISLNSELGKFGYFEPNYALDVAKVEVPVTRTPDETEQLTFTFDPDSTGVTMNIKWDKTLVRVPITVQ